MRRYSRLEGKKFGTDVPDFFIYKDLIKKSQKGAKKSHFHTASFKYGIVNKKTYSDAGKERRYGDYKNYVK